MSTLIAATLHPKPRIDVALTLASLVRGPNDPTTLVDASGAFWRATRTPLGAATVRVVQRASGDVDVRAWGEGAEWAIAHAPELMGASDSLEGFAPKGKLGDLARRFDGLRMPRTRAVYDAALYAILEQLVSGLEAYRSYVRIVRAWSEPAPLPERSALGLWLPPSPRAMAARSTFDLRAMAVGLRRAHAIAFASRRAERLEATTDMPRGEAWRVLTAFRGIGPWTAARVAMIAHGDPDAVPLGDYNLPNVVAYAFTGAIRGDDAQMLELLAPYAGHRARVLRLIELAGIFPQRFRHRHRMRTS